MKETSEIVEGILAAESINDQQRQPNPNGKYPVCIPGIKQLEGCASICARCGGFPAYDRPCPAVPPEERWGEDYPVMKEPVKRKRKTPKQRRAQRRQNARGVQAMIYDVKILQICKAELLGRPGKNIPVNQINSMYSIPALRLYELDECRGLPVDKFLILQRRENSKEAELKARLQMIFGYLTKPREFLVQPSSYVKLMARYAELHPGRNSRES